MTVAAPARPPSAPPVAAEGGALAIAGELREAILGGVYGHRQRLPPERRLAAHYGASRTTVREALRRLEAQRLVERRAGSGTFVTHAGADPEPAIAEVTSPLELVEVRAAIEPQMARLAVLHAAPRDIDRLEAALARLRATEGDPAAYSAADEAFHLALAAGTDNPLLIWLYGHINGVRTHAQWQAARLKVLDGPTMRAYNEQHAALVAAVRARDADAAARAMADQMDQARRDLLGANSR